MVILPAEDVDEVDVGDEVDGLQGEPARAEHHHHRDEHPVRPLRREGRKAQLSQYTYIQRSAKVGTPGLVNSIIAVAYHFCLTQLAYSIHATWSTNLS